MCFNRINDKEVSNESDNDVIGPEAERDKFDAQLFSSTAPQFVFRPAIMQQMAASHKLYSHIQQAIQPVQAHELVHQGVQAALGHLQYG